MIYPYCNEQRFESIPLTPQDRARGVVGRYRVIELDRTGTKPGQMYGHSLARETGHCYCGVPLPVDPPQRPYTCGCRRVWAHDGDWTVIRTRRKDIGHHNALDHDNQ